MKLLRHQRGDTIVEVLIAVAMLAFVVTTASAVSTNSTNTVRSSQERGEALKVAQSQVEHIISKKGLVPNKECFNSAGLQNDAGDKECAFGSGSGSGCEASSAGYCYKVNVTQHQEELALDTDPTISVSYKVNVDWDSLDGNKDTVVIVYKMILPNPSYTGPALPDTSSLAKIEQNEGNKDCVDDGDCPTNGKYRYRRTFTIKPYTNLNPSDIQSCRWNWGDGHFSPPSASNCEPGDSMGHTFPENPDYKEGADCKIGAPFDKEPYEVTLIITKTSGAVITSQGTGTTVPYCTA